MQLLLVGKFWLGLSLPVPVFFFKSFFSHVAHPSLALFVVWAVGMHRERAACSLES